MIIKSMENHFFLYIVLALNTYFENLLAQGHVEFIPSRPYNLLSFIIQFHSLVIQFHNFKFYK